MRFKIFVLLALLPVSLAQAGMTPMGFSLFAPVQVPSQTYSVAGARVSALWGDHRDVYGLDLGLIGNMTDNDFGGIGVSGIFNWNKGMSTVVGLQFAGLANINVNKARIYGLQLSAGINSNQAESTLVGLQVGLGNISPFTRVFGLQVGVYNSSREVYGFQVGLINSTQSLHGIQIGLINFNSTGLFSVAPLLNIGF